MSNLSQTIVDDHNRGDTDRTPADIRKLKRDLAKDEFGVDKDLQGAYIDTAQHIEDRMDALAEIMSDGTLDMTDVAAMQILNSQITNLTAASNLLKKSMEKASEMAQQR